MNTFELKREQQKLAQKIVLRDGFRKICKVAGVYAVEQNNTVFASVVVCEYPSLKILDQRVYQLENMLNLSLEFNAYKEMPAMIEAYNLLDQEPDLILVKGQGINHPRRIGIASHLGLALNKPTIGIMDKLLFGKIDQNKILSNGEVSGFIFKSREHANPLFLSPGHQVTLGSILDIVAKTVHYPHKLPEPLHLAHKFAKKKMNSYKSN